MECAWRSRRLHRWRIVHVAGTVRAIELDGALEAVGERDGGRPAGGARELARVGVEAADVDRLFLGGPRDALDAAAAADADKPRREIPEADGLGAADVEHFAVAGV